jgi:L-seryl-tRNA(Ser) seleniumtransferase
VDEVLRADDTRSLLARFPRPVVTEAVRGALDDRRRRLQAGGEALPPAPAADEIERRIAVAHRPTLRRAINATGVVLHTNLGRAPLPAAARAAVGEIATGYSTLEYDPAQRARGSRHGHASTLLETLTGAEAALVVNNNAGAMLVALAALGAGREAVVSRGELVEIGGGFRIPEVMQASGVRLREVGTTNKTRLSDYANAVGPETALLLKVHRSNFAIVGFTEDVEIPALAALGRERGLPVLMDLGSGALVDTAALGLPAEPTVAGVLAAGADVVAFSGDKLLGGPQAGLLVGRASLIDRIASHPLMRALRPDKLTLAALIATLGVYRDGTELDDIPTLRMLAAPLDVLAARKDTLLRGLARIAALTCSGEKRVSAVGGGALPLAEPETWAVVVRSATVPAETLARAWSAAEPSVVARVQDDAVVLDLRTVADDEVDLIVEVLARPVS